MKSIDMKQQYTLGVLFVSMVVMSACHSHINTDTQKEIRAITALLAKERRAHFSKDADLFMSVFADSMISVNKGNVSIATRVENKERIGNYFSHVEFIKWDDTADPLIRVSNDASMAYAIVQKQVILSYQDSLGHKLIDTTDFAWMSVYRKQKDEWKIECNISTNK